MISLRTVLDHPNKTAIPHSRNQNGVMFLFQTIERTRRQNAHLLSISPRSLSIKFITSSEGYLKFQNALCVYVSRCDRSRSFLEWCFRIGRCQPNAAYLVCNLIQDSHVHAAIKNLETKLENVIALFNKTRPLQPAPKRKSLTLLMWSILDFKHSFV